MSELKKKNAILSYIKEKGFKIVLPEARELIRLTMVRESVEVFKVEKGGRNCWFVFNNLGNFINLYTSLDEILVYY